MPSDFPRTGGLRRAPGSPSDHPGPDHEAETVLRCHPPTAGAGRRVATLPANTCPIQKTLPQAALETRDPLGLAIGTKDIQKTVDFCIERPHVAAGIATRRA